MCPASPEIQHTWLIHHTTICSLFRSVRSVMHKYLEKENEVNFDKIFNQVLGE